MLNAPVVVRRVRDRLARDIVQGVLRLAPLGARIQTAIVRPSSIVRPSASRTHGPVAALTPGAVRRRTAVGRRDQRRLARAVATSVVVLRQRLPALATERRGAPLLAVALLAVASILSQVPTVGGGTGGTDGAGIAYNPRIAPAAVDGPDGGRVDPSLAGISAGAPPVVTQAGAGSDASSYAMVDGSLIKPISAESSVADISGQVRTYVVRSGDTLSGIADRFGLSMMTIWWANHLTSADTLHVGQKLQIPPVDGVLYKVQRGDTVITIARKFHANAAQIRAFNGLTGDTVVIGQEVMVPDGHGAPLPTATPAAAPPQTASISTSSGAPANGAVGSACTSCSYSGSMLWPVPGGFISQYYWWGHPAIDIAAAWGTPVLAAAAGVVTYAGWRDNGGGYQVWISHGNNIYTTYNHMSAVMVAVGERVARGQQVGRVGATGDATGPHCHFEVWIGPIWDGGSRVNPLDYLSH